MDYHYHPLTDGLPHSNNGDTYPRSH